MLKLKSLFILPILFLTTACATPAIAPVVNQATDIQPVAQEEPQTKTVQAYLSFNIEGQTEAKYNESLKVEEGTVLLDLMQGLANEGKFQMEAKGEGESAFIESLNGIKGDAAANKYWLLYVNNEMSSVGAGSYVVKDGDVIEWKYMDTSKVEF